MTTGQWVLLASVVLALGFGLWRARTDGRFRTTAPQADGFETLASARSSTSEALPGSDGFETLAGARSSTSEALPGSDGFETLAGARSSTSEVLPVVEEAGGRLETTPWQDQLGSRATLVQFSTAFCAPCRTTRRILEQVASEGEGIAHIEIDAEHHLELVRRMGIVRTPTTVILDGSGVEISRASGAPTLAQVRTVVDALSAR